MIGEAEHLKYSIRKCSLTYMLTKTTNKVLMLVPMESRTTTLVVIFKSLIDGHCSSPHSGQEN